jgi:iron complex outermembrane receptor protein
VQRFGGTTYFDLEGSYRINDNWKITAGGRNIFDDFPDKIDRIASDNDNCCGRTYVSGSIVPWQGGYWYARIDMDF